MEGRLEESKQGHCVARLQGHPHTEVDVDGVPGVVLCTMCVVRVTGLVARLEVGGSVKREQKIAVWG